MLGGVGQNKSFQMAVVLIIFNVPVIIESNVYQIQSNSEVKSFGSFLDEPQGL